MIGDSLRGRLIVATPSLVDPNFAHTVVFVLDHTDEGAVGVVLNRPSNVQIASALPGWERLAVSPPMVFVGGPVQPTGVICLALSAGSIETVDPTVAPEEISAPVDQVRVFAGYAGWGAGQLEAEIAQGAWFVVDGFPEDAMSGAPDHLWRAVLRRQSGRLKLFANYPVDVSMN